MTVDGVLAFVRRYAALALLSIIPLWGVFVWQNARTYIRNDFQTDKSLIAADHLAFYTGARLTRFGPEERLYDYPFVLRYQNQLFWKDPQNPLNDTWRWLEAFRNPPHYAMLYWPLCGQSYFISSWFWFLFGFVLVGGGVALTAELRHGRTFLWVLSFLPCYMAFDYGQNTTLSFALFAGVYALLKRKRPFEAGLVAGLLLFKPQLLLGLGIWALLDIRRKWPCALGVIVAGLVQFSISGQVIPTAWAEFLKSFNSNREFDSFDMFKMHNPLAFIRMLTPAEEVARFWFPNAPYETTLNMIRSAHNLFALLAGLAATGLFVKLWWHRRNDLNVMFGGVMFLTLWANPHSLIYEWLLLALTGILWVNEWRSRPNTWFVLYAVAWGVLYFSTDLSAMLLEEKLTEPCLRGVNAMIQLSVPVLAGVGFYAVKLLTKPVVSPPPS